MSIGSKGRESAGPQEIRIALRSWLLKTADLVPDTVLIDELCFVNKKRRADLVHANGQLSAFEVKSSADTLRRWPEQQADYLRAFDELWLCCHSVHIPKALSVTSSRVGLIVIDDYQGLAVLRHAKASRDVSLYEQTGFLWRSELDEICAQYAVETARRQKIREVREAVVSEIPAEAVRQYILRCLKDRYREKDYSTSE